MKYLKFEFDDRADMLTELAAYRDEEGNWKDCAVVELGYLTLKEGEYNDEGEEIKAPIKSKKYSADVLFYSDFLESEKERLVNSGGKKIKVKDKDGKEIEIEGVGVHTFGGLEYLYEERRKEKK